MSEGSAGGNAKGSGSFEPGGVLGPLDNTIPKTPVFSKRGKRNCYSLEGITKQLAKEMGYGGGGIMIWGGVKTFSCPSLPKAKKPRRGEGTLE